MLLRPDDIHAYERCDGGEVSLWNFNIRRLAIEEAFAYLGSGFRGDRLMGSKLPPMTQLNTVQMRSIIDLLQQIIANPSISPSEINTMERVLLIRLLTEHFYWRDKPDAPLAPKWFGALLEEMSRKERFTDGLSALHKLSPVSREHLIRTFRSALGVTPNEWINEQRLTYAANLLKHSDEDILGISIESGFVSVSSFYAGFRKRFGISPAQYRKRNGSSASIKMSEQEAEWFE